MYGGKWDVTTFAWQLTPDADLNPDNSCTLIPPNGQNVTRLCDPALEKYLQLQKVTYSVEARKPIVAAAAKIIADDVPYEVIYVNEDVHAYNRDLQQLAPEQHDAVRRLPERRHLAGAGRSRAAG